MVPQPAGGSTLPLVVADEMMPMIAHFAPLRRRTLI
jgi:hypothetical protein